MTEHARLAPALTAAKHRPQYHFLPPANWLNDPNGLIQWRGRYHLFYQHNPFAPTHGQIHWGHAVSDDLVHWTHLPIALAPTPGGPDEYGCWSGCAVVDDAGRPVLVYTGLSANGQRPCLAYGDDDLVTWAKYPGNPVIAEPPPGVDVLGFRDHSIWREDGMWYQIIGSGTIERGGMALLYRSPDLRTWEYLQPLTNGREHSTFTLLTGQIWECPDLFALGDRHVLLVSAWHESVLCHSVAFVGHYTDLAFAPQSLVKLDYGDRCFYAPQTMRDDRGRRLMWGWIGEGRAREAQIRAGWAGVMSLPRQLTLGEDGCLRQSFVPELAALRGAHYEAISVTLAADQELVLPLAGGRAVEIQLDLPAAEDGVVGVKVLKSLSGNEATEIYVDWRDRSLVVERMHASFDPTTDRFAQRAPLPQASPEHVHLHIYVDHSVVEAIACEQVALTTRVYPTLEDSQQISLFARGGPSSVTRLNTWRLGSAW